MALLLLGFLRTTDRLGVQPASSASGACDCAGCSWLLAQVIASLADDAGGLLVVADGLLDGGDSAAGSDVVEGSQRGAEGAAGQESDEEVGVHGFGCLALIMASA